MKRIWNKIEPFKRWFFLVVLVGVILIPFLTRCEALQPDKFAGTAVLGLDLEGAELLREGGHLPGPHGDCEVFRTYRLTEVGRAGVDAAASGSEYWRRLPLSENCRQITQRLALDDEGRPYFPEVTEGWYFFLDRHTQATDPTDDAYAMLRGSSNFTMAIYDPAEGLLHFYYLNT